jgi:hypothetical protein
MGKCIFLGETKGKTIRFPRVQPPFTTFMVNIMAAENRFFALTTKGCVLFPPHLSLLF